MPISMKVDFDTAKLGRSLDQTQQRVQMAAMRAINDTAYGFRLKLQQTMQEELDRPTAYAFKSVRVTEQANSQRMRALVGVSDSYFNKQGKSPADVFGHLFEGGARRYKGLEGAMRYLGYIRGDYQCVPASDSWGVTLNANGNVSPGFVIKLIAYFKGFQQDGRGYTANMTDKTRARREKIRGGRKDKRKNAPRYRTIEGVVYFAVPTHATSGRFVQGRFDQHLRPGIWAKRGMHGFDIAPVFLFVRPGSYRKRIHIEKIGAAYVPGAFDEALDRRLRALAGGGA